MAELTLASGEAFLPFCGSMLLGLMLLLAGPRFFSDMPAALPLASSPQQQM
jgi:hypothetical protein